MLSEATLSPCLHPVRLTPTLPGMRTLGSLVSYWRDRRGLSQSQLAERIGASQQEVSKIEKDKRATDTLPWLRRLAQALDVEPWQLLSDADPTQAEAEQALLKIFRRLPHDERDRLLRLAEALLPRDRPPGSPED